MITNEDMSKSYLDCIANQKDLTKPCKDKIKHLEDTIDGLNDQYRGWALAQNRGAIEATSLASNSRQLELFSETNSTLDLIEQLQRDSQCKNPSTVSTILPFLAAISPESNFGLTVGAAFLFSRFAGVFKKPNLDLDQKIAICDANHKFEEARSNTCKSLESRDAPQKKWMTDLIAKIENGKKTKFFDLMKQIDSLKKEFLDISKLDDTESTTDKAAELTATVTKLHEGLVCSDPHSKTICDTLMKIAAQLKTPEMTEDDKTDTDDGVEKRVATARTMVRELNGLRLKDARYVENGGKGDPQSLTYYPTGEKYSSVDDALLATKYAKEPFVTELASYKDNVADKPTFVTSAKLVNDAFSKMPPDSTQIKDAKTFCEATSCIWAAADVTPPPSASAINGKGLHPTHWDPLGPQTPATYTMAGEPGYPTWDTVIKAHRGFLNQLDHVCSKKSDKCKVTCQVTNALTTPTAPPPTAAAAAPKKEDDDDDDGKSSKSGATGVTH